MIGGAEVKHDGPVPGNLIELSFVPEAGGLAEGFCLGGRGLRRKGDHDGLGLRPQTLLVPAVLETVAGLIGTDPPRSVQALPLGASKLGPRVFPARNGINHA